MKDKIIGVLLAVFIGSSTGLVFSLFIYACYISSKWVAYTFLYEDQVIQTIEEYMQKRETSK